MTEQAISPLCQPHDRGHDIRTFSDKTQRDYIRHIESFARFLRRSPATATGNDIRGFQLAQVEQGARRRR
jgi:integrase/recombinase XerD